MNYRLVSPTDARILLSLGLDNVSTLGINTYRGDIHLVGAHAKAVMAAVHACAHGLLPGAKPTEKSASQLLQQAADALAKALQMAAQMDTVWHEDDLQFIRTTLDTIHGAGFCQART